MSRRTQYHVETYESFRHIGRKSFRMIEDAIRYADRMYAADPHREVFVTQGTRNTVYSAYQQRRFGRQVA